MAEMTEAKKKSLTRKWMGEISDAQARESKYRKLGQEVVDLYEAKHPENTPFAILYSNTETLAPAVYNARPIPMVKRRFKDADPIGKAVADVSTRTLKFLVDTEDAEYDAFDDLMQACVLDGLLTNRGVTRFRYVDHEGDSYGQKAECVYGDAVRWDKFFHGYARTWKKVPWIGFEWDMSKEELKSNFPKITFDRARLARMAQNVGDEEGNKGDDREETRGAVTYRVYEIWDKDTRKVMFFSGCADEPLKVVDDPFELSGFFPVPRPLNFMRKVTTMVPVPLYQHYRSQAAELNSLTIRLKAIIKACKVRGFYNSAISDIDKVLEAEDNKLIPADNMLSLGDNPDANKLIWLVPINELVQSAQTLYQQREQVKQVIYEITGISDILRGASVASETATAQNIKNQWGTLRLKKMQKEVQRYCREALAIMLEIASHTFEQKTFQAMTGLPLPTNEEKQHIQMQIQTGVQQFQMISQQAQAQGQQPSQPPPEVMQKLEEGKKRLAAPSWEDVLGIMKNDIAFYYKVDIETNSTIDAEAAQDKQDIAELMNAMGQFLNAIGPLVKDGTMPMEVAKGMLLTISRRFNFGGELEEAINTMAAPKPEADPNEQAKAESAKMQLEADKQKAALDAQKAKQDAALSAQEFQQKQKLMILEAQIDEQKLHIQRQELDLQRQGMAMKMQLQERTHRQKMETAEQKGKESADASV